MKNNIISGGISGSIARVGFLFLQFFSHFLLAKNLGAEGYGIYQFSISLILILSVFGHFAIPKVALKYISSNCFSTKVCCSSGFL